MKRKRDKVREGKRDKEREVREGKREKEREVREGKREKGGTKTERTDGKKQSGEAGYCIQVF